MHIRKNDAVVETHLRTSPENNAFSSIWKTINLNSFAVILVRWIKRYTPQTVDEKNAFNNIGR